MAKELDCVSVICLESWSVALLGIQLVRLSDSLTVKMTVQALGMLLAASWEVVLAAL